MARITYAEPDDLPAEKRDLLQSLSETAVADEDRGHSLTGDCLNVYRALGQNIALLEGFRTYGDVVWNQGGLSASEREIVILATAYYADAAYEWHQHVRVALNEGMAPEQILAISREEPDHLESKHAALIAYVEQFVDGAVDDDTHEHLTTHYDDATLLGVGMLSGCYLGLARVLQALQVDPEDEFVGWDLENL